MARLPQGVKKRENGTYESRFTVNGKRHSVYGKSILEVKEKEKQKMEELMRPPNEKVLFSDYYKEWADARVSTKSVKEATSLMDYRVYKNWLGPEFGKKRICEITVNDCREFQKKLVSAGLAPNTINNSIIKSLKHVLYYAVDDGIIKQSPAKSLKNVKKYVKEASDDGGIHRALTEEELEIFFRYAEGSLCFNLWRFLLATGMRASEAAAVCVSDISATTIRVNKTLTKDLDGHFKVGPPKSAAGIRDIPLTEEAKRAVECQKQILYAINGNTEGRLFTAADGTSFLTVPNIDEYINRVLEKIEKNEPEHAVKHLSSHSFRVTFATRAVRAGVDLMTLKRIMGHSNLTMLNSIYVKVQKEDLLKAARQLDRMNGD